MLETCTVVATACKNCDNKRENQNRPGFQFERNCRCDLLWRMLQALDTKNRFVQVRHQADRWDTVRHPIKLATLFSDGTTGFSSRSSTDAKAYLVSATIFDARQMLKRISQLPRPYALPMANFWSLFSTTTKRIDLGMVLL